MRLKMLVAMAGILILLGPSALGGPTHLGRWNPERGVQEVWAYDQGDYTYIQDCGTDSACQYTDAEGQQGQCSYTNPITLETSPALWEDPGSTYSGLGSCVTVKVWIDYVGLPKGRYKYRTSVTELLFGTNGVDWNSRLDFSLRYLNNQIGAGPYSDIRQLCYASPTCIGDTNVIMDWAYMNGYPRWCAKDTLFTDTYSHRTTNDVCVNV